MGHFRNDAGERAASQGLFRRPQNIDGAGDMQDEQPLRRQSEKIEPRPVNQTRFRSGKVLLDPERLPAPAGRQRERKAAGDAKIERAAGRDIVQRSASQTAPQGLVDGRHPERDTAGFLQFRGSPFDLCDRATQTGQGERSAGGHVSSP